MAKPSTAAESATPNEHFDVLIVGAGISGIAGAYHLRQECPDTSFVILESEASFGGTWWTHRSPGIRSDSDLHTFGYNFKPWVGPPIATAKEILSYMGEVIEENNLAQHIRYRQKIIKAEWSEINSQWTVEAVCTETDETTRISANFLWMCQGYYRHNEGYTPEWDGMDDYQGQIAHPENWPDNIDYAGKSVVVIGSGAKDPQKMDPKASRATLDHSIMYILAVALQDGEWHHVRSYTSERARREDTVKLWHKVSTVEDAAWTRRYHDPDPNQRAFGGRLEIFMSDGTCITDELTVANAHSAGARPFSRDDYVRKFKILTKGVLEPTEGQRFLDLVQRLPDLSQDEVGAINIEVSHSELVCNVADRRGIF